MLVFEYIVWHFVEAPREILKALQQIFLYSFTYFSTGTLLKTLFFPWRRFAWSYPKNLDIGKFFEALISNMISRILGACMRSMMIVYGVVGEVVILLVGIIVLGCWFMLPFVIGATFFYGFIIIF